LRECCLAAAETIGMIRKVGSSRISVPVDDVSGRGA
jgi:hypothetical protein